MSNALVSRVDSLKPSAIANPNRSHWAMLAGLRFLLASVVVFTHLPWFVPTTDRVAFIAEFSGLSAVFAFLMISGYSIANSIAHQQQGFYRRRIIRILPMYWLAVVFSYSLKYLIGGEQAAALSWSFDYSSFNEFLGNLFLLQGVVSHPLRTNLVIWTLSVEVFFYLLAPLLVRVARSPVLLRVACISLALLSGYRVLKLFIELPYYSDLLFMSNAALLGWAWLIGFWFFFHRDRQYHGGIILLGFSLIVTTVHLLDAETLRQEPLFIIPCVLTSLVLAYGHLIDLPHSIRRLLLWLGDISYPLYLFHFPLLLLLFNYFGWQSGILLYTATFTVVAVIDHYVDKPARSMLSKLLIKPAVSPNAKRLRGRTP